MVSEVSVHDSWLHWSGPVVRQKERVSEDTHLLVDRKQKKGKQEVTGTSYSPRRYFLQLGPISYFLPPPNTAIMLYESIRGLIHWLGQSPQDLITSKNLLSWQTKSPTYKLVGDFHIQNIIPSKQVSKVRFVLVPA
jgi:hypothetical protein